MTVLKVVDIQNILKIGKRQAYELVSRKDFPSIKIGGSWRIPEEAFFTWINRQSKGA